MRLWLLPFLPAIFAIPAEVGVTFSGFRTNYNPGNHNKDSSIRDLKDYFSIVVSKISDFFGGKTETTISWTEKPHLQVTKIPSTLKPFDPEDHPGNCPTRVDAYVDVKNLSLVFQGDKVFIIQDKKVQKSFHLETLFPDERLKHVTAALYNKNKDLLILFSDSTVFGFLFFGNSQKWYLMTDYPKELPSDIKFIPHGAIRWLDDSQVLLSDDGRLAMYDEVLNEALTTGNTEAFFKGLPEKIQGASNWKDSSVQFFTERTVFEYDKNSQKLQGTPLSQYLFCS